MVQNEEKGYRKIIPEEPLKKNRKGGAVKLILTSLFLEAARMRDEGVDIVSIETAGKEAFSTSQGFLSLMDEIGIKDIRVEINSLSDTSNPQQPLYKIYRNFFQPPQSLQKMMDKHQKAKHKSRVKWVPKKVSQKKTSELMLLEMLKKRFQAVAFMVASEIVESGLIEMKDVEKLCKKNLSWKEGPFSLMNQIGIEKSLQMVTEEMEISHRKEINFPIPRLLIEQAQKKIPWEV